MGPQARLPRDRKPLRSYLDLRYSGNCDPLDGIEVSDAVRQKTRFTGYLRRGKTPSGLYPPPHEIEEPFFLVTTGGGARRHAGRLGASRLRIRSDLDMPAKIVLGPFMGTTQQTGFMERVARLKHIEAIAFEANMEALMQRALGVVAMGGYNTFCEILSLDKRALIVPRTAPRAEQFIRATRAEELGLAAKLMPRNHRPVPDGRGAPRPSLPAAPVEGTCSRPSRRALRHQRPRRPVSRRQDAGRVAPAALLGRGLSGMILDGVRQDNQRPRREVKA